MPRKKVWNFHASIHKHTFSWNPFNPHCNDDGQWPDTLQCTPPVFWVRQTPHTMAENISYRCRLNPMFSIGQQALTRLTYQKRSSQTKIWKSFCINISCILHQLVAKPLLLIPSFFIRHLNIYNLIMIQFLRLIFSLTVIFKFLKRIIARSDLASSMHAENPGSCAVWDTAA